MEIEYHLINNNFTKGNKRKIDYIVIHYTAGVTSKRGSSINTANWFNNPTAKASAHYIVDDEIITQAVSDADIAWHCGSSSGYIHPFCRNNNSIGIEICSSHNNFLGYDRTLASDPGWYITRKAREQAAELTASLMKKYNINISHVVRHFDVTGKDCPSPWVDENKEGEKGWIRFLDLVQAKLKGEEDMKYKNLEDCPEWSREGLKFFIDKGYLKGESDGLNLTYSDIRLLIILYRTIKGES